MEKGHEPSRAENLSARAMARASSARAHHYCLHTLVHSALKILNYAGNSECNRSLVNYEMTSKIVPSICWLTLLFERQNTLGQRIVISS